MHVHMSMSACQLTPKGACIIALLVLEGTEFEQKALCARLLVQCSNCNMAATVSDAKDC